jgi:hypothetical protein
MNNYAHIEPKLNNKRESYKLNIRENNIRENNINFNVESMFEKLLNITEEFNNKLDRLDKKVNDKFEELFEFIEKGTGTVKK